MSRPRPHLIRPDPAFCSPGPLDRNTPGVPHEERRGARNNEAGLTRLVSPGWSHQAGLTRLVSPGWSHQAGLTRLVSPGWSHQAGLTRLVSPGWSHQAGLLLQDRKARGLTRDNTEGFNPR
ncbi:hypothetical protein NHX12_009206 [Muraenolepis orangiensis]|uniref:Uncharacterized protein n=1 Tax=Muraenolepis orangiensis TaxID=630683 RepID=A0A9Q0DQC5_9TELE|nr:hypothetical protein NHX12_009206 [Muraenolepis orangiensis]